MNEQSESQETPQAPAGVIACLTSAFELLAQAPQLLLLPLLLDLFLWLGPRLAANPLVEPLLTAIKAAAPTMAETQSLYQALTDYLTEFGQGFNLFALLSPGPLLGTPALMGGRLTLESPLGTRATLSLPSVSASLGWGIVLIIVGAGITAVYLTQIGKHVLIYTEAPLPGPTTPLGLWGQLLRLMMILVFLGGGALMVVSTMISVLVLISQTLASLLTLLFISLGLFIGVHFLYTIPGMVQLRHAPLPAMQESVLLARVEFAGVMQLLLLAMVFTQGLNFVWTLPEPSSWATLVGIGGHAIISTALTITLFIFYQERLAYLRVLQNAFARNAAHVTH